MNNIVKLLTFVITAILLLIGCADDSITTPADVPLRPRLLRAMAVNDTAVYLTWRDVSQNEDGVKIYESVHPDSDFVLAATVNGHDVDSVLLGGKDGDTPYRYQVQAFNLYGGSFMSETARTLDPEQIDYFDSGSHGNILSIDVSPDSRYVAAGMQLDARYLLTVECWEIASGQLVFSDASDHSVQAVAFSPDDQYLASGEYHPAIIKVWSVPSGEQLHTIELPGSDYLISLAFNPVDEYLAAAVCEQIPTPGIIRLYQFETWQPYRMIEDAHPNGISDVAFSPDGLMMASSSWESRIRLWSGSGASLINTLSGIEGEFNDLCFSMDNNLLASASDDSLLRLWNVEDGELVGLMQEGYENVTSVAFSPDSLYMASGAMSVNTKIWDYRRWALAAEVTEPAGNFQPRYVKFTPDGECLIVADYDGMYVYKVYR